ncbi:hypothetical protein Back11_08270 [Paenibacillus baekrokdamisoli]|uniref:Uncharacterized protein n=1 Tax=Paenibacillus baekrokdamisoli TaxID=1712516 RepID=A0A3G9IMN0_9BACL|nr:hypothetical protein [Paenibacillus baekrokdamisoli]BBH19482.1 hypothetical protein Back11_08270 [Paenibacillus baekrokdamisoli]
MLLFHSEFIFIANGLVGPPIGANVKIYFKVIQNELKTCLTYEQTKNEGESIDRIVILQMYTGTSLMSFTRGYVISIG